MTTSEHSVKHIEHDPQQLHRHLIRATGALGLLGTTIGGLTGCVTIEPSTPKTPGECNDEANVTILFEGGARIRENPHVSDSEFSNRLVTVGDNDAFAVKTSTLCRATDANGQWYGVPVAAFPAQTDSFAPENIPRQDTFAHDNDEIVWVNEQRADIYEQTDADAMKAV